MPEPRELGRRARPAGRPEPEGRGRRHKRTGAPDTPQCIEASKRYLADFGRLEESTSGERELFDTMTELYPDWASHQSGLMFGRRPSADRSES